jgi:hypothetical protein
MGLLPDILSSGSGTELFVLGADDAGKSLLVVGVLEAVRDRLGDDALVDPPSAELRDLAESFTAGRRDAGWPDDEPADDATYEFTFDTGGIVSTSVRLSTTEQELTDIDRLPDALPSEPSVIDDDRLRRLKRRVEAADCLVYVVDCERILDGETPGVALYAEIVRAVQTKRVLVVATKADLFAEEFLAERAREPVAYFEEFREFVEEQLRSDPSGRALLQSTDTDPHPVYYRTELRDGRRQPVRQADGSVESVGFEELVETLI